MRTPRFMPILTFLAACLAATLAYMLLSQDPCARLVALTEKVEHLSVRPRPYRLSDHVIGLLHRSNPLVYYQKEAEREKRGLLASGQLIEVKIPYTAEGPRSDREIAKALLAQHRRTGAYYWIDFDVTNRLMLVVCRPRDLGQFSVLK